MIFIGLDGILGLVDDTIGVTEAGYKAHDMNAFLNIFLAVLYAAAAMLLLYLVVLLLLLFFVETLTSICG